MHVAVSVQVKAFFLRGKLGEGVKQQDFKAGCLQRGETLHLLQGSFLGQEVNNSKQLRKVPEADGIHYAPPSPGL